MKRVTVTVTLIRRKIVHFDQPPGSVTVLGRLPAVPGRFERFRSVLRRLMRRTTG
jgi:hypothetical protein